MYIQKALTEKVKKIWSIALDVDEKQINENDSFFDLGGNSLQALILTNILTKDLKVGLSIQDIYQYETFKEYIERLVDLEHKDEIVVKGQVDSYFSDYSCRVNDEDLLNHLHAYNDNVENGIFDIYKMLKIHRYFYLQRKSDHITILSTKITVENCSLDDLKKALEKLVEEQSILRMGVSSSKKKFIEYKNKKWKFPVIIKNKVDDWNKFYENLSYIRNEPELFSKGLLSKILILQFSETSFEVRIFIHHSIWDRMSHIIIEQRLKSIINDTLQENKSIELYTQYMEDKRVSLTDKIEFHIKMAIRFIPYIFRYRNKIHKRKVFEVTLCWEPHTNLLLKYNGDVILFSIAFYGKILNKVGIHLNKIPIAVMTNSRSSNNANTLGLYINTAAAIYNMKEERIQGVLNKHINFNMNYNEKLIHELCHPLMFFVLANTVPIINYVSIFPGYYDMTKKNSIVKEIIDSGPEENRVTIYQEESKIYMNFHVYAKSKEEVVRVLKEIDRI